MYYLRTRHNFFPLITSLHDVSIKKDIVKTIKSESDFQLLTPPPAKPAKQKNPLDIENSVRYPPRGRPYAAAASV